MPTSPLFQQLANRAKLWHSNTGVSQLMMARAIGMEAGNYNAFLKGNKGLGAESTCLLLKFLNMPNREVVTTFSAPVKSSSIVNFQSLGQSMQLANDGWVSGRTDDPDNTEDITQISDAASNNGYDEATTAILKKVRSLHRQAIRTINDALNKAKPNPNGTTESNGQRFSTRNIPKTLHS
jgi:hypothetical protein